MFLLGHARIMMYLLCRVAGGKHKILLMFSLFTHPDTQRVLIAALIC